jgi:hypothetical protein
MVRPSASTSLTERTEAGTAVWIVSIPTSQNSAGCRYWGEEIQMGLLGPLTISDRVDQEDRVDALQRPVLPHEHVWEHLVGDLGDRLPRDPVS